MAATAFAPIMVADMLVIQIILVCTMYGVIIGGGADVALEKSIRDGFLNPLRSPSETDLIKSRVHHAVQPH